MDVTTRKRGLPAEVVEESSGAAERGEGGDGETELCSTSSCLVQGKRCRQVTENSVDDQCWSPSSGEFAASYCSSTEIVNEDSKILDLEEESVEIKSLTCDSNCRERRETTPLSELGEETGALESNSKPPAANSRRRSTAQKMPSEAEIEEFFAAAEKKIQKEFTEKYNFDIVKDKPLKGRYEWVPLKP
ncbi:cyclin-dependent kinase inhibitor 6-like [Apium graveolens]|uniref:Cyclin-dependent kinase inhibitor domain-containing protein n=1 Tax=Apium graveolens TaxID=4045 RepID=A0A6L5B7Y8_APIGR|nr:hypothetical protein AG4045_027753 [Apium graveolens]